MKLIAKENKTEVLCACMRGPASMCVYVCVCVLVYVCPELREIYKEAEKNV